MMQSSKLRIHWLLKKMKFVEVLKFVNIQIRGLSSFMHGLQLKLEWNYTNPEYFDHNMDIHHQWRKTRMSFPLERGVFSSFALAGNGKTLDLCSGDGFNSYYFYSLNSKSVTGIDFDAEAIKWARRNYKTKNLDFIEQDIRNEFVGGPYDNIIWDAAIEHFTEIEIKRLMNNIKSQLTSDGVLSGYTIIEASDGVKHLHQHEYEFHDKEDLARFLIPWFKNVHVFTTSYPTRTNLYFYASDGLLPFEKDNNLFIHSAD